MEKSDKKTELLKNKIGAYLVDSKDRIWIGTGTPDMFFDSYAFGQLYQGGVASLTAKNRIHMSNLCFGCAQYRCHGKYFCKESQI